MTKGTFSCTTDLTRQYRLNHADAIVLYNQYRKGILTYEEAVRFLEPYGYTLEEAKKVYYTYKSLL